MKKDTIGRQKAPNLTPILPIVSEYVTLKPTHFPKLRVSSLASTAAAAAAKLLQSCPTLRNPIDGSPPGSPIPGILKARTLEWVAIFFSNS